MIYNRQLNSMTFELLDGSRHIAFLPVVCSRCKKEKNDHNLILCCLKCGRIFCKHCLKKGECECDKESLRKNPLDSSRNLGEISGDSQRSSENFVEELCSSEKNPKDSLNEPTTRSRFGYEE